MSPQQELFEAYGEQLRAKISSKFSASTFLAGFAATILTTLLTARGAERVSLQHSLALGLAIVASFLFVHAIVRLDELSMPKRFWPSKPELRRVTDDVGLLTLEDLWALYHRMVYCWQKLTMVATGLTGIGLVVLTLPAIYAPAGYESWTSVGFASVGAIVAFLYVRRLDARMPDKDKLVRPVD